MTYHDKYDNIRKRLAYELYDTQVRTTLLALRTTAARARSTWPNATKLVFDHDQSAVAVIVGNVSSWLGPTFLGAAGWDDEGNVSALTLDTYAIWAPFLTPSGSIRHALDLDRCANIPQGWFWPLDGQQGYEPWTPESYAAATAAIRAA